MGFMETTAIAVSLAMDAFSVCVAAGVTTKNITFHHYFRLSFHFGLFQFLMPVAGYYSGKMIAHIIGSFDHWIALVLLSLIGLKMIWESFDREDKVDEKKDPSRGLTLVLLAVATSIDAAAVGFSFAALGIPVLFPAAIIGIVCVFFSALGLFLGNKIGSFVGTWAERAGGVILILIGIKILFEHLQ